MGLQEELLAIKALMIEDNVDDDLAATLVIAALKDPSVLSLLREYSKTDELGTKKQIIWIKLLPKILEAARAHWTKT